MEDDCTMWKSAVEAEKVRANSTTWFGHSTTVVFSHSTFLHSREEEREALKMKHVHRLNCIQEDEIQR